METTTTLWAQIVEDPRFHDLPYRIETNARGQIIMSPHKIAHSKRQGRIQRLLERYARHHGLEGEAFPEAAVETTDGIKTADVVWLSAERNAQIPPDAAALPIAPEICVEVLSRSNTAEEMAHKRQCYFERGAMEVWLVDEADAITFYAANETAAAPHSRLMPDCPASLEEG